MQVEGERPSRGIRASNVETALFFERPAELFQRVYRLLRPQAAMPEVQVEFHPFAGANARIQLKDGRLTVKMADMIQGAPAPVLEALAFILISKLFGLSPAAEHSRRYRRWLNRKDVRRMLHLVRQSRGRKVLLAPQGEVYDLVQIFERINTRHFRGLLARPELGWSASRSRVRLAHYDPSHNAIMVSRILDQPHVPELVIDYVVFHEMLHLVHPVEHNGSKRRIHTAAFRAAEKEFPRLQEARSALRNLLAELQVTARLPESGCGEEGLR